MPRHSTTLCGNHQSRQTSHRTRHIRADCLWGGVSSPRVSWGPPQALTILAKLLSSPGQKTLGPSPVITKLFHSSLPTLQFRQDSALWLLIHSWHRPWPAKRSCASQLQLNNPSPHLTLHNSPCATSACKTLTFLKGLQAKIFGNWLASINAVEGEHQLETSCFSSSLRRVWDLQGKLYRASGTKHRLAPLLHLGLTPAKTVTESVKHNSQSPSLRNTIQNWQACSLTKSASGHSERTKGHHNHSTLSHLHKSGQTKLLIPIGSTGCSCETWFLISAPRHKGVTRVIYTDKQATSNNVFSSSCSPRTKHATVFWLGG